MWHLSAVLRPGALARGPSKGDFLAADAFLAARWVLAEVAPTIAVNFPYYRR